MNNFEIYGTKTLEKISDERIKELNKISVYEYKTFMNKHENKSFIPDTTYRDNNVLEQKI